MAEEINKETIRKELKEYCPNCGHDRSQDEHPEKFSERGCHTPPQDFPTDFLKNHPFPPTQKKKQK